MTRRRAALAGHLQPRFQKHYLNTSPNLILHVQTRPPVAAELLSFSPIPPLLIGILSCVPTSYNIGVGFKQDFLGVGPGCPRCVHVTVIMERHPILICRFKLSPAPHPLFPKRTGGMVFFAETARPGILDHMWKKSWFKQR